MQNVVLTVITSQNDAKIPRRTKARWNRILKEDTLLDVSNIDATGHTSSGQQHKHHQQQPTDFSIDFVGSTGNISSLASSSCLSHSSMSEEMHEIEEEKQSTATSIRICININNSHHNIIVGIMGIFLNTERVVMMIMMIMMIAYVENF